jgi:gamma-glutamyltranspeptidase/glutathione hydrolase
MGTTHMVCAGHNLAAAAGYRILEEGGNAIDAGVAAGIAINVVLPENTNFGGVAPIIVYLADTDSIVTISGLGRWPRAASIDYFKREHDGDLPLGILRAVVPSAPDAWLTALERYGTLSLEQVITPALELAEEGFPLSAVVQNEIVKQFTTGPVWKANGRIFMPGGRLPQVGDRIVQSALADTFKRLIDVEHRARDCGRSAAIRAARDYFYQGELAREIADFSASEGGLLCYEDLRDFSVGHEAPVSGQFQNYSIYTCGPWCQGPVVAQVLQMLANDNLKNMGHNSSSYIHLISEALNLAFSDREHYFGDPDFVDVPISTLLSSAYTQIRRAEIDPAKAFGEMPPPGKTEIEPHYPAPSPSTGSPNSGAATDTSYTCTVDRWGNAFSATPSDQNTPNPIIPELGFSLSCRGYQSWLDPAHASSLAPLKRPRLTPNPAIALKDGKLFMPFGCPGGDAQCQAMVQVFLNIVEFDMAPQVAVEQPRFATWNFPNSFWPHGYLPGRLNLESRMDPALVEQLKHLGHDVVFSDDWDSMYMGVMGAITVDTDAGLLRAGADPRRDTYAIGR